MKRGELYRVYRPGRDPKLYRTFVVVSRQVLIESKFSTVTCAPVFRHGEGLSTQLSVGTEEGLKYASWIMCDNLVSLRKADLTQFVGSLTKLRITELDRALKLALGLS